MPKSWQKEMDFQRFDPLANHAVAVVTFMECIEMSEDFDSDKKVAKVKTKKNNKTKKSQNALEQKCYVLHGNNNTHSMEECRTLKAQAKKLNSATGGATKDKAKGNNKTRTNKSKEDTDKSKEELAAFVKKAIKNGVKQEIKAIDKNARTILTMRPWISTPWTLSSSSSITGTWTTWPSTTRTSPPRKMERSQTSPLMTSLSGGQVRIRLTTPTELQ